MSEESKVLVRVEYEQGGKKKVCCGEVDQTKLEKIFVGTENFICIKIWYD